MFFWNDKSEDEKAADRLLSSSQDELVELRDEMEERNERLSIQIVSNQRKIQELLEKGKQAPDPKQRIIAQKCSRLERQVKKAQRELKENLSQLSTLNVAELLVEGRKSQEFTEQFKDIVGADDPNEFQAAVQEIQARQELGADERERLSEIGDMYDSQYSAAEESDPDKFLDKMQGADEDFDAFAEPEPITDDEVTRQTSDEEDFDDRELA